LLSIKRGNAEWQRITMERSYQLDTINKMLRNVSSLDATNTVEDMAKINHTRETEGLIKIFGSKEIAQDSIRNCEPLSAIVDYNDLVCIAYRPNDGNSSRSMIMICELQFEDTAGELVENICWFSPINITENTIKMSSITEVNSFAKEYALLLPYATDCGDNFVNNYYVVGSNWTERQSSGSFRLSELNVDKIFIDWIPRNIIQL
jgi:hypothetical protein